MKPNPIANGVNPEPTETALPFQQMENKFYKSKKKYIIKYKPQQLPPADIPISKGDETFPVEVSLVAPIPLSHIFALPLL
jgi:hypothetical protein